MLKNFNKTILNSKTTKVVGYTAAALWIFGGALFFYGRFTVVFYRANQRSIDEALVKLLEVVP